MLNKLQAAIRQHQMLSPGQTLICAVSGGADSMALLWGMYLLRERLDIRLSAAHFNHNLRGEESRRDEAFVRQFCADYRIPFHLGSTQVQPGEKGLEAAARDARYAFLSGLSGKVATAHTADDNAETLLMHLVRGTGLKGLGGIAPVRGNLIRPMLQITRREVMAFLEEYSIPYVEDSSNAGDVFLRNRIRHNVMPLLVKENPSLALSLSVAALRLRQDAQVLDALSPVTEQVPVLRQLEPALRSRSLAKLLTSWGVKEPEAQHIHLLEQLVFSPKPSARANFPGGVVVQRNYDRLELAPKTGEFTPVTLSCPCQVLLPELGCKVTLTPSSEALAEPNGFCVRAQGAVTLRTRQPGDVIRLSGGSKRLKELFIDRKIPAFQRSRILVACDEQGILGVQGIGPDRGRLQKPNVRLTFEPIADSAEADE